MHCAQADIGTYCIEVNHLQLFVTTRHVASRTANSGSNGSAIANAKVHANINGTLPKMIIIRGCAVSIFAKKFHIFRKNVKQNLFRKTLRQKITWADLSPLQRSLLDYLNISLKSVLFRNTCPRAHKYPYFDYISRSHS